MGSGDDGVMGRGGGLGLHPTTSIKFFTSFFLGCLLYYIQYKVGSDVPIGDRCVDQAINQSINQPNRKIVVAPHSIQWEGTIDVTIGDRPCDPADPGGTTLHSALPRKRSVTDLTAEA